MFRSGGDAIGPVEGAAFAVRDAETNLDAARMLAARAAARLRHPEHISGHGHDGDLDFQRGDATLPTPTPRA